MFSEMCVSIKLNWFVIFLLTDGFRLPMFGKAMPPQTCFFASFNNVLLQATVFICEEMYR